jgi:hypothetical protein
MPVIPALRRLTWEDFKFKASLSYIVRFWLKTKQKDNRDYEKSSSSRFKPLEVERTVPLLDKWQTAKDPSV